VIEDDATEDVETSGTFDASLDGIDFWESLEGMFLQLNDAVAVGPRSGFGESRSSVTTATTQASARPAGAS
jgi:hypothetical protein